MSCCCVKTGATSGIMGTRDVGAGLSATTTGGEKSCGASFRDEEGGDLANFFFLFFSRFTDTQAATEFVKEKVAAASAYVHPSSTTSVRSNSNDLPSPSALR
jgi:hypothetical protein